MAAAKTLEPDSIFAHLDADGDGIITDEEMAVHFLWIKTLARSVG